MSFYVLTCSHQGLEWAQEGIQLYEKRIKRFSNIIELPYKRLKLQQPSELTAIQKQDETNILQKLPKQSIIFTCDASGKQYTSEGFAKLIDQSLLQAPNITFIIGPAYGLPKSILKRYPSISLSTLTFQHEMAQLLLYEQIYRGLTIINNHPYHR